MIEPVSSINRKVRDHIYLFLRNPAYPISPPTAKTPYKNNLKTCFGLRKVILGYVDNFHFCPIFRVKKGYPFQFNEEGQF